MSKAFTKDDDDGAPLVVPHRAPLPKGVPNYVTAEGLGALREEHARLTAERARLEAHAGSADGSRAAAAALSRVAEIEARIASAELVDSAAQPHDEVRFGATITVRAESGAERRYRIVGVDEADVAHGRVAFVAPLSRALLGKRVGDVATVRMPGGEEELTVVAIAYGA